MEYIFAVIIALPILLIFSLFLIPYIHIKNIIRHFGGNPNKVEEKILNNQLDRIKKATGITLPPFEITLHHTNSDINGGFWGIILIKFQEEKPREYWQELERLIKNANYNFLWTDSVIYTKLVIKLYDDSQEMLLTYGNIQFREGRDGFRIHDAMGYDTPFKFPVQKNEPLGKTFIKPVEEEKN